MKASLITLLAAALLGAGIVQAQNEYAEIARLRGLNESVRGIRSMADGEHYTTLENNDILRYSYAEGVTEHTLTEDREVHRAVALLDDGKEYARILHEQDTVRK